LNSALFISQFSQVIYVVQNFLIEGIHFFNHSKKCSNAGGMDDHRGSQRVKM